MATTFQPTINTNKQLSETLSYPRTGKRGVPQQFPRRLYTMLQSETAQQEQEHGNTRENNSSNYSLIQWSESGQAFRILDIEQFSTYVLPKYFRTSKFSSFQRNLNLVSIIVFVVHRSSVAHLETSRFKVFHPPDARTKNK